MRINSIGVNHYPKTNYPKILNHAQSPINQNCSDKTAYNYFCNYLPFLGYNVHIFDGGSHAQDMENFAHAISNDMDIVMHDVDTNDYESSEKQMYSLYEKLSEINENPPSKDEFVAIPVLFSVALQNIQDQYKEITGKEIKLTPENVIDYKSKLLEFLKELSEHPNKHKRYIGYMDPNCQGLEWVYPVIQQINKLVNAGYKVYVPSGHPEYQSIKWLAEERNEKPELYNYISSGEDVHYSVNLMRRYIQESGWYDFNLLALSEANVVNLKNVKNHDYIYSAYDSTITDSDVGTYNFTPIRDNNGNVLGYSFTDEKTVQVPFDKFHSNYRTENLNRFVGKKIYDVLATPEETDDFKTLLKQDYYLAKRKYEDKLFDINKIFSENQIEKGKMRLKGEYVDSSTEAFFTTSDSDNIVLFKNCDCDGTHRPSVYSMWGSCFSIFNIINQNIDAIPKEDGTRNAKNKLKVKALVEEANSISFPFERRAVEIYDEAIEICQRNQIIDIEPYIKQIDLCDKIIQFKKEEETCNKAINMFSKYLYSKYGYESNNILVYLKNKDLTYKAAKNKYIKELEKYNSNILQVLFAKKPTPPDNELLRAHEDYNTVLYLSELFSKLSHVCFRCGKHYPSDVCRAAAKEIKNHTQKGSDVIKLRAMGETYLGDLFDDIKK